jgi:predicted TIM-barrel fold metal-dependent hydrolase
MSTTASPQTASEPAAATRLSIVDCDVHTLPPSLAAIERYMPARWRGFGGTYARVIGGASLGRYPRIAWMGARHDAWPEGGLPAGGDLDLLRAQLLDAYDIDRAIMTPVGPGRFSEQEYAAVHVRAFNEWQTEWLDQEPRLSASIVLSIEEPISAAQEVRRAGADRRFVQALGPARSLEPLGRRKYWPIWEAAAELGLPVAFHYGGIGHPSTGTGWPTYYFEDHSGMSQSMASQVASFVFEGVFDRFPDLRVVLVEGGFAWLKPLMWRMDDAFDRFRGDVAHLRRRPSEYVRDHVWMTTQPIEEPTNPRHLADIIDDLGADRLLFASDYPHWDFDPPDHALPSWIGEDQRRLVMGDNARALYRLG